MPPTTIRYRIIGVTMLMAFILYLDRICMAEIVKSVSFNSDLKLTKEQIGSILSAFFFTYALCQVPAGWASDRFGARTTLTLYIVLWSLCTMLTGFMSSFVDCSRRGYCAVSRKQARIRHAWRWCANGYRWLVAQARRDSWRLVVALAARSHRSSRFG